MILTYSSVGIALFVGWMLLGRLAGMSFSKEGKSYWVLKSAPLRASDLLTAKFLVAYVPTLTMGWFFVIVISLVQKISAAGFLYSLLAVALSLAGMNGIMIAFGAAGANFNWDDPRRMNAGSLGCLGQIVTMLVLPIVFGVFVAPIWLAAAAQLPLGYAYLFGAILGTVVNLLCAYLPLKFVEARVQRLGEVE